VNGTINTCENMEGEIIIKRHEIISKKYHPQENNNAARKIFCFGKITEVV